MVAVSVLPCHVFPPNTTAWPSGPAGHVRLRSVTKYQSVGETIAATAKQGPYTARCARSRCAGPSLRRPLTPADELPGGSA